MSPPRRVRLPRTAQTRLDLTFAILIHRVLPQRVMGDAFEGPRFRPGATVAESELWPEPDYPKLPLLIEYAGSDRAGNGHRRSNQTYILWRFDPTAGEWAELARSAAVSTEWVETLKAVALRHLTATEPENPKAAGDATARVLGLLELELEPLESRERSSLLGLLWEQVLGRLVREGRHV
jgi:hypothetical protein